MPSIYAKAAISEPELRQAYVLCRRIVRTTQPGEYALSQLIPPALRPACWALWSAGRVADDLVDSADAPQKRETALDTWTAALEADLKTGTSRDLVRRALVHTVLTWNIPPADLYAYLRQLRQDTRRQQPTTWQQWSTHSRSGATFTAQTSLALTRLGLNVPIRLHHLDAYRRWLSAFLLVDSLEDLSDDISLGHLDWPLEAFEGAGAEPADLLNRRWTPGVETLIAQVHAQALEWLAPVDTTGLPPALTVVFDTSTALYHARLRAVRTAGAALLHRAPRQSRVTRWRILAPARAKAALALQFTPVKTPLAPALPQPEPTPTQSVPHNRTDHAPHPPIPHPSGARPPALPAERMPRHVAIIMDGNGRWATQRGLPRTDGHHAGEKTVRDVIHGALEIGLPHLSLYAFSTENWKRSSYEVDTLMSLMHALDTGDNELLTRDVRFRWAGAEQGMPDEVLDPLRRLEDNTRHHTGLICTLCVNYGGRAELAQAAGSLARAACAGQVDPNRVSEHILARYLPDMPDVDLLWRPGGEHRTSNFLPWQATYAELHFTDTLWPDIDRRDLWQAITHYAHRERRYGTAPHLPAQTCNHASDLGRDE